MLALYLLGIRALKVWKAKEPGSDIVVALKMIKATDKEGNSFDVWLIVCTNVFQQ